MVTESNPFAPPTARVDDVVEGGLVLAGRGTRLGAVLIDGLIQSAVYFALIYTLFPSLRPVTDPQDNLFVKLLMGLALSLTVFVVLQCYLLNKYGQTIGKRLLGIRIVRSNGDRVPLGRLLALRYVIELVIAVIPIVGVLFVLVDSLLIFRESRRCLHDNIADTIVIKA